MMVKDHPQIPDVTAARGTNIPCRPELDKRITPDIVQRVSPYSTFAFKLSITAVNDCTLEPTE